MSHIRTLTIAAALIAGLLGINSANATTFHLDFTQVGVPSNGCCGPFDVSATLDATANGDHFNITGISGTVTQNGTAFAITGLIPAPSDPGNLFGFDNIILANAGGAPYSLDNGGIGFYASGVFNFYTPGNPNSNVDPYATFNIWGNGGSSGTLGTTASYDANTEFKGTYSLNAAVPEPGTWAMMILGFAGVGFMAYRRRN